MRKYIVFDIETMPRKSIDPFFINYFKERRWCKGIGKPEDGIVYDKEREQIDRMIEPTLSQMYCFCFKTGSETLIGSGLDEKEVLVDFWNKLSSIYNPRYDQLVSFNGINFDIQYVMVKSSFNRIQHFQLPTRRYDFSKHFDVRMWLTNWSNYVMGNLKYWATAFELDFDKELANSNNVVEWYKNKEYDKIQKHNIQDVIITEKLYLIIKDMIGK